MKKLEQLGISPTPWTVDNHNNIRTCDGHTLAATMVSDAYGHDRTKNDAFIIAAAPKLYAACYEMLRYYYEQNTNTTVFNTALELMKQAVAEAAGESEVNDDA